MCCLKRDENISLLCLNITIVNTFITGWVPSGNIHHYQVVLVGNSNHKKVDTARHSPPKRKSEKHAKCLVAFALIKWQHNNNLQNSLGYIPLLQAWAYHHHLFEGSFTSTEAFFETMKAANTDIKQLNFINMPIYTYINVCSTIFLGLLAFGSSSKHFHCTKLQSLLQVSV